MENDGKESPTNVGSPPQLTTELIHNEQDSNGVWQAHPTSPVPMDTDKATAKDDDNDDSSDTEVLDQVDAVDIGHDELVAEGRVDYVVTNLSKYRCGDKLYSDSVIIDETPFQLLVYPNGNKATGFVSVFLSVDDDFLQKQAFDWKKFVFFKLVLHGPSKNIARSVSHCFKRTKTNYGFPQLATRADIADERKGFVVNDQIRLSGIVKVVKGIDVRTWLSDANYNSREVTGMVGLENQGATCYMNSLLQTLYHTNALRRAVFRMPTENDESKTGVALGLQRVFHRLQTAPEAVDTSELLTSFGWGSVEAFMQHDVQEFSRVLMDNLEEKMKATSVADTIPQLFKGTMKSFVRCLNVDFESSRIDEFYDIQLNVKGMRNLERAFEDYIAVERLDGDNQYKAEGHGLQDAEKGIVFQTFPPVLHLQLKRFEYSFEYDDYRKVNDRFEFPDHINLDKFLEKPEDTPADYVLHSVLVHMGSIYGGHYIAFIRPDPRGRWFEFDDETVTVASPQEALHANFGEPGGSKNAYMLVYVRDSCMEQVMSPLSIDDIPPALVARFEQEEEHKRKLEQEQKEAIDSVQVEVIDDSHMLQTAQPGLLPWRPTKANPLGRRMRLPKTEPMSTLIQQVGELYSTSRPQDQRLFLLQQLKNQFRIVKEITSDMLDRDMETVADDFPMRSNRYDDAILVYVMQAEAAMQTDEDASDATDDQAVEDCVVMVKRFDPSSKEIVVCKVQATPSSVTLVDSINIFKEWAGFEDPSSCLLFMEETALSVIEDIDLLKDNPQGTLGDLLPAAELSLIFIAQPKPTPEALEQDEHALAPAYMRFLGLQVEMEFFPKATPTQNGISVRLQDDDVYSDITTKLAAALGQPDKAPYIQLYEYNSHSINDYYRIDPIRRNDTLRDMRHNVYQRKYVRRLAYDILDIPVEKAADMVHVDKIHVKRVGKRELERLSLWVAKPLTFDALADAISEAIELPRDRFRLLEMSPYSLRAVKRLQYTNLYFDVYVEEIPEEQLELPPDALLVVVYHVTKDCYKHDQPFLVLVKAGEKWDTVRERIRQYLGVSQTEFDKWPLKMLDDPYKLADLPSDENEGIQLSDLQAKVDLALVHSSRSRSFHRSLLGGQGVKIHN